MVAAAGGVGVCDGGWARARSVLVFLPCHIVLVCSRARLLSTPLWTALHTQGEATHTHTHTGLNSQGHTGPTLERTHTICNLPRGPQGHPKQVHTDGGLTETRGERSKPPNFTSIHPFIYPSLLHSTHPISHLWVQSSQNNIQFLFRFLEKCAH